MAQSLEEIRKKIETGNTLKVRAEERVSSLRQQFTQKNNELKELGVENPKDIENEIKKREIEIENLKNEIANAIPDDIISKYANVNFASIAEEEPDLTQPF